MSFVIVESVRETAEGYEFDVRVEYGFNGKLQSFGTPGGYLRRESVPIQLSRQDAFLTADRSDDIKKPEDLARHRVCVTVMQEGSRIVYDPSLARGSALRKALSEFERLPRDLWGTYLQELHRMLKAEGYFATDDTKYLGTGG